MVSEFFVNLGVTISGWIAALFPPLDIPAEIQDSIDGLYGFLDSASGLGNWFPWSILATMLGLAVVWFLAVFGIKLLRWVWSLIPVVGGGS